MKLECSYNDRLQRLIAEKHWYPPYCNEPPTLEYCGMIKDGLAILGRACNRVFIGFYSGDTGEPLEYDEKFVYALLNSSLPGYTFHGKPVDVIHVEPGPPGTTSIVSIIEDDNGQYALKAYRLPTPQNIEPMILNYLTIKGNKHVPIYRGHGEFAGYTTHLLTEWLGETSIVPVFFDDLLGRGRAQDRDAVDIARKIGEALASIHEQLKSCDNPLCKPEPVEKGDISRWVFRVQWRLENMALHGDGNVREIVERLYSNLNAVSELASPLQSTVKLRTHGDLHLYQVFIDKHGTVKILDFEGEPDRIPGSVLEKETVERDLACILRSLHYIAANAYLARTGDEAGLESSRRALQEYRGWITRMFNAVVEGYLERGGEVLEEAIFFWSIERALYEFYYESMWRTGLEHVPLAWLEYVGEELYRAAKPFLLMRS